MLFVRLEVVHPAFFDELDDPSRVEVDTEADAAAMLRQVLDGETQTPRARRAEHQPVCTHWEVLLGQCFAEQRIVDPEVFTRNSAFWNTRRAAGFEDVDGFSVEPFGHPASYGSAAKPLVFERRKLAKVIERADIPQRIKLELLLELEPKRAAGGFVEVPRDGFRDMRVERFASTADGIGCDVRHGYWTTFDLQNLTSPA